MIEIAKSWEGKVQFYELAFGTWIAYLFLVFMWERIFGIKQEGWRYSLITLLGASFYIINHYFLKAPFYKLFINSYTALFFILYYIILVHHLKLSFAKKTAAFLSQIPFTLVYILAENFARFGSDGRLIPNVYIHESVFLTTAFVACIVIILSYREKS